MKAIHIFNPDTDYALASNSKYFTPSAQIIALRRKMALLPSLYASKGDIILLLDEPNQDLCNLDYYEIVQNKKLKIITLQEINSSFINNDFIVIPWGWNRNLVHLLSACSLKMKGLPGEEQINKIRNLSHRRSTITILSKLKSFLPDEIILPVEIFSVKEALDAYAKNKSLYFKAPWSSSGRGIMFTQDLQTKHIEPWIKGIIRRQGSVMMETAYKRKFDFATEWFYEDGEALFLGYSVFKVSRRGKYHGNLNIKQNEFFSLINKYTDKWNIEYLTAQKEALQELIGSDYEGPLGIDMFVTDSGSVNPCVEINLRHTMGMVELLNNFYENRYYR